MHFNISGLTFFVDNRAVESELVYLFSKIEILKLQEVRIYNFFVTHFLFLFASMNAFGRFEEVTQLFMTLMAVYLLELVEFFQRYDSLLSCDSSWSGITGNGEPFLRKGRTSDSGRTRSGGDFREWNGPLLFERNSWRKTSRSSKSCKMNKKNPGY